MRIEYFLFAHHTASILAKLSTWCFEHSSDISCSLLVNPSHTDDSWERRNTCMYIYMMNVQNMYIYIYTHTHIYIYIYIWLNLYIWFTISSCYGSAAQSLWP